LSKKKKEVSIEVIGGNAENVTGSCTKIDFFGRTILFELGMIQDNSTILGNYRDNCAIFNKIKPKKVEMIIVGHDHCDHIGLIPMLFARGNTEAKIIVPKDSTSIIREMWSDCAFINERDAETLNRKDDKSYTPLYTQAEVDMALKNIIEVDIGSIVNIDDNIAIRYTPAGHILRSCQTELYINGGSHTRKILFTSDLGNRLIEDRKFFVENFEPVTSANIAFVESTYGRRKGSMTKKDIDLDRKKMKSVIDQYCIDSNHRVLIPTFSLDRMPFILWELYQLYGDDENFKIPILVDSPLANRLLDCYSSILDGESKEKFDEMMLWKNIHRVITPEDSKAAISDKGAKVICASSGMLTAGRSVKWVQSILPNENDCILFIGYSGEDTLSGRIKNGSAQKTININGKPYKNKCNLVSLCSFSSHMQHNDLVSYYKSINTEKIYLVHGDKQARIELKEDLEKALTDCCKSTRVVIVNKGTKISL
jgi:metallo-beta-lactamase family protein